MMQRMFVMAALAPLAAGILALRSDSVRKDANGIYALVDSVAFEGTGELPDRIKVWGVFAMPDNVGIEKGKISYINVGGFFPAKRGYLYYTINKRDEALTRKEWAGLAKYAGTGQSVAFGATFPPNDSTTPPMTDEAAFGLHVQKYNGRLRRIAEKPTEPDTFPFRMGNAIVDMAVDPARATLKYVFHVPDAASPADGGFAAAGGVELVAKNAATDGLTYHFTIESLDGRKDSSGPVPSGEKQTKWTPKMKLRAGGTYTWSVAASAGSGQLYPAATSTFIAK